MWLCNEQLMKFSAAVLLNDFLKLVWKRGANVTMALMDEKKQ